MPDGNPARMRHFRQPAHGHTTASWGHCFLGSSAWQLRPAGTPMPRPTQDAHTRRRRFRANAPHHTTLGNSKGIGAVRPQRLPCEHPRCDAQQPLWLGGLAGPLKPASRSGWVAPCSRGGSLGSRPVSLRRAPAHGRHSGPGNGCSLGDVHPTHSGLRACQVDSRWAGMKAPRDFLGAPRWTCRWA